jgi:hypothetical protein
VLARETLEPAVGDPAALQGEATATNTAGAGAMGTRDAEPDAVATLRALDGDSAPALSARPARRDADDHQPPAVSGGGAPEEQSLAVLAVLPVGLDHRRRTGWSPADDGSPPLVGGDVVPTLEGMGSGEAISAADGPPDEWLDAVSMALKVLDVPLLEFGGLPGAGVAVLSTGGAVYVDALRLQSSWAEDGGRFGQHTAQEAGQVVGEYLGLGLGTLVGLGAGVVAPPLAPFLPTVGALVGVKAGHDKGGELSAQWLETMTQEEDVPSLQTP